MSDIIPESVSESSRNKHLFRRMWVRSAKGILVTVVSGLLLSAGVALVVAGYLSNDGQPRSLDSSRLADAIDRVVVRPKNRRLVSPHWPEEVSVSNANTIAHLTGLLSSGVSVWRVISQTMGNRDL